jgi:uncharacterized membrane protein YfcA
MDYLLIGLMALLGATVSFFSGFGLGTLLLPVFMLFFPPPVAIACTAVVHLLNNIFKLFLVGKFASKQLIISFGLPSVIGAMLGAIVLQKVVAMNFVIGYKLFDHELITSPINWVMAILILFFSLDQFLSFAKLPPLAMWIGGGISGFFGGLSGHQGALRSAFLSRMGLTKEIMLGTRAVCAVMVDLTRIIVYASFPWSSINQDSISLIIFATFCAWTGAWIGNRWVKKITINALETIIAICLIVFSVALAMGLV